MVAVVYYRSYLHRFSRIISVLSRWAKFSSLRIVVNNPEIEDETIAAAFRNTSQNLIILRHDNEGLEFGGYQRGLDDVLAAGSYPWDIVFANDTLGTHQPINEFFLRNFHELLKKPAEDRFIAGRIDYPARAMMVGGLRLARWVRANLFAVDYAALAELGNRIYQPGLNACINNTPDQNAFFAAGLCCLLRDRLANDLFAGGWDRSEPLSQTNFIRMANKARSILQEFYFAARLDAINAAFLYPRHLTKLERLLVRTRLAGL